MRVFVAGATGAIGRRLLPQLIALDIVDGVVQTVRSVINPEKLRHLGPLADERGLLRGETGGEEA